MKFINFEVNLRRAPGMRQVRATDAPPTRHSGDQGATVVRDPVAYSRFKERPPHGRAPAEQAKSYIARQLS
jgi:hypothetical protein